MKYLSITAIVLFVSISIAAQERKVIRENPTVDRRVNATTVATRITNIQSEDSAAVFGGNERSLVRGNEAGLRIQSLKLLNIQLKPKSVIMDVRHPFIDGSYLRFGQADIDFEENEARFVYRLDPRAMKTKTTSSSGITSYSKTEITQLDQRAYEFFYGFVSAKVNFIKTQKYLIQFTVESKGIVDYVTWIRKNHTEVGWSSSNWTPLLPAPNQHFYFAGNKKVSLVIEPGEYEGDHYIMLGGNFQNGSWKFTRFEMTPLD